MSKTILLFYISLVYSISIICMEEQKKLAEKTHIDINDISKFYSNLAKKLLDQPAKKNPYNNMEDLFEKTIDLKEEIDINIFKLLSQRCFPYDPKWNINSSQVIGLDFSVSCYKLYLTVDKNIKNYSPDIIQEAFNSLIQKLKHGWQKRSAREKYQKEWYMISKNEDFENECKLLELLTEKFGLKNKIEVNRIEKEDKPTQLHMWIQKDFIEQAFIAFDLNVSYRPNRDQVFELFKQSIQDPNKTQTMPPVLANIVIDYLNPKIDLFKLEKKDIDKIIKKENNHETSELTKKRKLEFEMHNIL